MRYNLTSIGWNYFLMGKYNEALDYYNRNLKINEEIDDKLSIQNSLTNIGLIYFQKADYKKAQEYLDKSATIQMTRWELDSAVTLETTSHLLLSKKMLGLEYNVIDIHQLIDKDKQYVTRSADGTKYTSQQKEIDVNINYTLYQLLEDKSYLETAYNQVQEKADSMEEEFRLKFLSYPIPKAIVEEWEKVK